MNDLTVRFKVNFRKAYRRGKETVSGQETPKDADGPKAKNTVNAMPGATRIARMLALAYFIERQVEAGKIRDYATAAKRLGISRARMTQVMNLLNLPVHLQETILAGGRYVCERQVREMRDSNWLSQ